MVVTVGSSPKIQFTSSSIYKPVEQFKAFILKMSYEKNNLESMADFFGYPILQLSSVNFFI